MKTNLKEERLEFRLSKAEKREVQRMARLRKMSMGEYLRMIIVDTPEVTYSEFEHLQNDLIYEIRKIGVNINQIAKKYNEGGYTVPRQEILSNQQKLDAMVKEVTYTIIGWYAQKQKDTFGPLVQK